MVKVSEIKDRDSLEAWLLDRPEEETKKFAITIAHRAVMRVLPLYWEWVETSEYAKKRDLTALPILRCGLISGVARKRLLSEAGESAYAAASASASSLSPEAPSSAAWAIQLAVITDDAYTAAATVATVADVDTSVWEQVQQDCDALQRGDLLLAVKLWSGDENPFQKEWDTVCQSLTKRQGYGLKYDGASKFDGAYNHGEDTGGTQTVDWSFWINWYQDALEGREPDWDMLEEIALIPDEDWKKGPEHINNEVIAGIVEKYAKQKGGDASASDTITPSADEKKAIVKKVVANREALALSIAGVLEQITEHREHVRKLNSLEPEYKEGLLDFLDQLSKQLSDLLGELPNEGEVVSERKSEKLALWWREYKVMIGVKARAYATPENISEATVPAAIILGCTGIGAIFGPFGATAGGVVGSLITGQIKPGKAAGELMKDLDAPDGGA